MRWNLKRWIVALVAACLLAFLIWPFLLRWHVVAGAMFKMAARERLEEMLVDYDSAKFKDEAILWEKGSTTSATYCGKINAKNRMGAYTGWKRFFFYGSASGRPFVYSSGFDESDGISETSTKFEKEWSIRCTPI